MAPDEMTVTVIQGRGTAQYTPLEQYGGDTGHTDARSDIYAFGATLYHLLTSQPPPEAKLRFLNSAVLSPPRALNPEINPQLEHAVLWAMALHPDDRPQDIAALRHALRGATATTELVDRLAIVLAPQRFLPGRRDRVLAYMAGGLFLLAVLATII
jgi:serine/threonine-protein kinase